MANEATTFTLGREVSELKTRMESNGNERRLSILALNYKGEIVASATHFGADTCGTDVYDVSIERAKELDSKRKSRCIQT